MRRAFATTEAESRLSKIIFITGTDTGVGKTLLAAALLLALRRGGVRALAMKPFCSGGWGDVELIQQVQGPRPDRHQVAPFYFPQPLAPLAAARASGRSISLHEAKRAIMMMARKGERLIVEGVGGVLAPLGTSGPGLEFAVADLIAELDCDVVVVAPNRLGVINHTCLTVEALRVRGVERIVVVLMEQAPRCKVPQEKDLDADYSVRTNALLLRELLRGIVVLECPFLGPNADSLGQLKQSLKKLKKTLASIGSPDSFCARLRNRRGPRQSREGAVGPKRLKAKKDRLKDR